jgi:dimethylamine monooxygenase subunit A
LVERDGGLVVGGGSVCFPNRWDLRSKLGRTMAHVHQPVARLNEQLAGPIDGVLARLRPERSFWRLGWGVLDTGELYQAVDGTAPPRPGSDGVEHLSLDQIHLRVERETLRRFPRTGCVLFTIRTHTATLRQVAEHPADARLLAEAVAAIPADVADYKQLDGLGARVIELLGSV